MRWRKSPIPQHGEKRIIEKFLWLPKELNREVRWLERVQIEQEGRTVWSQWGSYDAWDDVRFVDKPAGVEPDAPWPHAPEQSTKAKLTERITVGRLSMYE